MPINIFPDLNNQSLNLNKSKNNDTSFSFELTNKGWVCLKLHELTTLLNQTKKCEICKEIVEG